MSFHNHFVPQHPLAFLQASSKTALILSLSLMLLNGCASLDNQHLKSLLGMQKNVIHIAYDIADDLEKQASPPLIARHPGQPILTTTFVNSNNLQQTSRFSRVLQDNMASRFVQLGYTVRETKLRNELNVVENTGELMLSRNLTEIQPTQKAQAIVVGTYSITGNIMYITARLVSPENTNILSSNDYKILMDSNMQAMFGLHKKSKIPENLVEEPAPSFMTRLLYFY